jgi:hypothetical protein
MNDLRGWSADPAVSRLYRVVEWIEDYVREHGGDPPSNRMIAEGAGLPVDDVITATELLEPRGLAYSDPSLSPEGTSIWMTADGRALASTWRAARFSPRQRRVACRDAVLDWLDGQSERVPDATATFLGDARASFYGQPFTPDDVRQAMSFLHGQRLIEGVTVAESDNVLQARITDDGRACIEQYGGSVADWMSRGANRGGDTITTTITNSPGAQWANESPGAQQSATVITLTTDARTQVLQIADQIIASLEAVDLTPAQRQEANAAAVELRDLAKDPAADRGRLRAALGVIATATLGAIGTEAGQRVIELVREGLRILGG